ILSSFAGPTAKKFVIPVEPAASEEMKFDVGLAIDLAVEQIDHVEVTLSYGTRREQMILDTKNPRRQISFWYRAELGTAIQLAYDVEFLADSNGQTPRLSAPPVSTSDRVIRLNPRDLYQRASLRIVAKGIPFDRYPSVIVDLKATDPVARSSQTETVELTAANPESLYTVRAGLDSRVLFERRIRYLDTHGSELTLDWNDADAGVLIVPDPLPDIVD